jgi:protein phosphatase
LVREENQDSAGRYPQDSGTVESGKGLLFAVADGMGGHRGGKVASGIAIETLIREFSSSSGKDIQERLRAAFESANAAVRERGQLDSGLRGMGTTLTVLVFTGNRVHVAHVGDSRAYWIRPGSIEQITEDHSIVAEWLRKGWLTEEQAHNHPERSLLYRALGVSDEIAVDLVEDEVTGTGNRFLLCTDGLTNHVEEEELLRIVVAEPPQKACDTLVALALERGGFDNITVQTIRYDAPGEDRGD